MERIDRSWVSICLGAVLMFSACGKSSKSAGDAGRANANSIEPVMAEANSEIQSGKFDDAAAKLMGLRASGHEFSEKEALAYRRAVSDAYSAAVAAAAKGDPRGKAAMEMLRATGNR